MEFAIETINLVKRYPTTARRGREGHFHLGPARIGRVESFTGLLKIIKGIRGPFIEALRGVNIQIKKGEIFGVLGPNGAGKTTLIKILCTLVIHDEGEAYVNGFDVKREPNQVLKNLQAVLPESRGFNWRLTGRQNLEFYALLYGLNEKEAKERIDYLLDFTGLKDRADDYYQRYSTGMQRKLLLCRSLLRNTPILLFDEPTVGLDPTSAAEFRDLLHKKIAHEEKKTILLSTHNLFEAQNVCDRIAILDRGKITACDTPNNIRYLMFDEKVFNIAFVDAIYDDEQKKMIEKLEEISGVHGVTPGIDLDGNFHEISIRVDKNMDLSSILEVVMKSGLKIKMINTKEPTLEDAFMAITRQHVEPQEDFGSFGQRS
ncbi:MAG: ABC transporter ATP-binding protein [Candidatus Bathyarchaeia archaeon]